MYWSSVVATGRQLQRPPSFHVIPDPAKTEFRETQHPAVPARSRSLPSGTTITVSVDSRRQIKETNKTNNVRSALFQQ
jgi:hypothetical protein